MTLKDQYNYFKGSREDFITWLENLKKTDPASYQEIYKSVVFINPKAGLENMSGTYDPVTGTTSYSYTGSVQGQGWMYANGAMYSNSKDAVWRRITD